MIRLFLIDDHPVVIAGIEALLHGSDQMTVVGSAADGFQAVEKLRQVPADVALVDINLPDVNGIDLCQRLKREWPDLKILGLSTFQERSYITRMMQAGASGYLLKNAGREELEEAVLAAHRGRLYLADEVAAILTQATNEPTVPLLTAREKEVLALIAAGHTNQQIAEQLYISPLTVDSHRKNLLAKFGVKNTAAMIKYALECKLIE